MNIDTFNQLDPDRRRSLLLDCCRCSLWAEALLARGAASSVTELQDRAQLAWRGLRECDYLEAFAAHPRIGDLSRLREKFAGAEQGQVATADRTTLSELQRLNNTYFDKFGFIFLICASGKSAGEMLAAIHARIGNSREEELRIAAAEQAKITRLRLGKLFVECN